MCYVTFIHPGRFRVHGNLPPWSTSRLEEQPTGYMDLMVLLESYCDDHAGDSFSMIQYGPLFTTVFIPLVGPGGMFVSFILNLFHISAC